jgi:hypothetical protein
VSHAMSSSITAAFLDSGRALANAANAAAIVAGVGCVMTGPIYSRIAVTGSILIWFLESYYAVRVAIDSSLFRLLATDPEEAARDLDNFLGTSREPSRSIEDRARGALSLWRRQIAALTLQLTALIAGIVLRIANL